MKLILLLNLLLIQPSFILQNTKDDIANINLTILAQGPRSLCEDISASFNTEYLFAFVSNYCGNLSVEIKDNEGVVVASASQMIVNSGAIILDISNLSPGEYTLFVHATYHHYGHFTIQ